MKLPRSITFWLLWCILPLLWGCKREESPPPGQPGLPAAPPKPLQMIPIPAKQGYLIGGSRDVTQRLVNIDAFEIAECEITQALYQEIMGTNSSVGEKRPDHPVQNVSWEDAVQFCNRLSRKYKYDPCYKEIPPFACDPTRNGYRLPTSAEWEYACRQDTTTIFFWGNVTNSGFCVPPLSENQMKSANQVISSFASPVRTRKPNGFGLYDMAGNVAEWCEDLQRDNYRTVRGGSWADPKWKEMESREHTSMPQSQKAAYVGFRVVRTSK